MLMFHLFPCLSALYMCSILLIPKWNSSLRGCAVLVVHSSPWLRALPTFGGYNSMVIPTNTAAISSLTIISNDSPYSPIYEAIYIPYIFHIYIPYIFHILTIFTHLLTHIFTTMIGLTKLSINPGHDFSTACFFTQLARLGDKLHRTERRPNGVATPRKFRGVAWEIHGKIMGNSWENHRNILFVMGFYWENPL